jgi:hypothetical protein
MAIGRHDKAISFYRFQNSGNPAEDDSGWGRDAVNSGVAYTASLGGRTDVGNFASVDPDNGDYMNLVSYLPTYGAATSLSFMCWLRVKSGGTFPDPQLIFGAQSTAVASTDFIFFANNGSLNLLSRHNNVNNFNVTAAAALTADTWHHIAFSTGSNGAELWVDGVSVGTDASTTSIADVSDLDVLRLGQGQDNGGPELSLNAYLDNIYWTEEQLNLATVQDAFNSAIYKRSLVVKAGQSNNVTRAVIVGGIDDNYAAVSAFTEQFGFDAQTISAATNPLDMQDEDPGDMSAFIPLCTSIGPNLAFGERILLAPVAKGGSGFSNNEQNPGDAIYEAALSSSNAAYATNVLNSVELYHWFQGETDADDGSVTYQADLQAMYDDLIVRFNGFSASVPFVVTDIKGSLVPANVAIINAASLAFQQAGPSRFLVTTADLVLFDTYHFDTVSQREISTRVFNAAFAVNQIIGQFGNVVSDLPAANEMDVKVAVFDPLGNDTSIGNEIHSDVVTFDASGNMTLNIQGMIVGNSYNVLLRSDDSTKSAYHPILATPSP